MKTSLGRCSIRRVSPPRHVLVCGAGVVGASVAYCLARRGIAVTWLDGSGVVTATLGSTETTAQVTPARFTGALLDAAQARGAKLHLGVVEDVARRDGAAAGVVTADGQTLDGDAVVLAMGPWTGRMAARLSLPRVYGLKGYSVTLAAPDVPAH